MDMAIEHFDARLLNKTAGKGGGRDGGAGTEGERD